MPANRPALYLLAYDIADPRRLTRVHRTVRSRGLPLQYSVFIIPGTAAEIDRLLADLDAIIEPAADDIRVYPLPRQLDLVHYGRQWLSAGLQLVGGTELDAALAALTATAVQPAGPTATARARAVAPTRERP
ncbi:MAG: CRISPR-associated endonuclease Cas2 [Chromatiaceae bacterium]|nr:MAG: CRISPR-associated endonuclease Cas2 [Chromatiaceae bacterium]